MRGGFWRFRAENAESNSQSAKLSDKPRKIGDGGELYLAVQPIVSLNILILAHRCNGRSLDY